MSRPLTLGELRKAVPAPGVSVKEEMRRNLLRKLSAREPLFPGILGYEERPLVSSDFAGDPRSAIVDASSNVVQLVEVASAVTRNSSS